MKYAFPEAVVYASQPTIEHIAGTFVGKMAIFGPILGKNAPVNMVLPKVFSEKSLEFQGEIFQIVGDNHRMNFYHAEEKLLIGGIDVFNEMHIFLADTQERQELEAWDARLSELAKLELKVVLPAHANLAGSFDKSTLAKTQYYLRKAIEAQTSSKTSQEFLERMEKAYPDYINQNILDLSAKVLTGEMPWG